MNISEEEILKKDNINFFEINEPQFLRERNRIIKEIRITTRKPNKRNDRRNKKTRMLLVHERPIRWNDAREADVAHFVAKLQ